MPTALIVDDSKLMRSQLRQALSAVGITVVAEAPSGELVVSLYEEFRPDLVTLDIVMPGKDGIAVAIELLAAHPEARIVMCTSMTGRDKIIASKRAGVRHYLLKPFDVNHVREVCEYVLNPPPETMTAPASADVPDGRS